MLFRPVWSLLSTCWRASPLLTTTILIAVAFQALQPLMQAILLGSVVDSLIASWDSVNADTTAIWSLVAAILALIVITVVVGPILQALVQALSWRLEARIGRDLLGLVTDIADVGAVENSETSSELATIRGDNVTLRIGAALSLFVGVAPMRLSAVVMAGWMLTFSWWAPLILLPGLILTRLWLLRDGTTFTTAIRAADRFRLRATYYRDLILDRGAAKDIRLFGLSTWMLDRFVYEWSRGLRELFANLNRTSLLFLSASLALGLSYGLVVFIVGSSALRGDISIGSVSVYISTALGLMSFVTMPDVEIRFAQAAMVFPALDTVRTIAQPKTKVVTHPQSQELPSDFNLKLSKISFRYGESRTPVLSNISLDVHVGEVLAIVGANGSGKTTLVSVVTGLREPTEGVLQLGECFVNQSDRQWWRSNFAVLSQDFAKWELSLREHLTLAVNKDLPDRDLYDALMRVGLRDLFEELPLGLDTPLSRHYKHGIDLSGGQWQKVLLARTLISVNRGARILILDEPTSHLDLQAEKDFYEEFLSHTSGLTRILITHRLPAVAHADRIALLQDGQMIEMGSHAELMELGGVYAKYYTIQVQHFGASSPGSEGVRGNA